MSFYLSFFLTLITSSRRKKLKKTMISVISWTIIQGSTQQHLAIQICVHCRKVTCCNSNEKAISSSTYLFRTYARRSRYFPFLMDGPSRGVSRAS